jgi:hypothetical protein
MGQKRRSEIIEGLTGIVNLFLLVAPSKARIERDAGMLLSMSTL